jgi:hypothetical protein
LTLQAARAAQNICAPARRLPKTLDDIREVMDLAKKGQLRIRAF